MWDDVLKQFCIWRKHPCVSWSRGPASWAFEWEPT
jgi:hypothetical protein